MRFFTSLVGLSLSIFITEPSAYSIVENNNENPSSIHSNQSSNQSVQGAQSIHDDLAALPLDHFSIKNQNEVSFSSMGLTKSFSLITVRTVQQSDENNLILIHGNSVVMKTATYSGTVFTPEETKNYLNRCVNGSKLCLVIEKVEPKDSQSLFIGLVTLSPEYDADLNPVPGTLNLAYRILPEFFNQGYTSAAVKNILERLVPRLIKNKFKVHEQPVTKVVAVAHTENIASWRIMEKVGMKFMRLYEEEGLPLRSYEYSSE